MLYRIDVAIFDMTGIIGIVTDQVLPDRRCQMPRSLRAWRTALSRSCFGNALANRILIRRQRVEKSESSGGKSPHRTDVVRQHDDGVDLEGVVSPRIGNGAAQRIDVIDEQSLPPFQQVGGEEQLSTWNAGAAIIWHCARLRENGGLRFANPPYDLKQFVVAHDNLVRHWRAIHTMIGSSA
jgi:hypothetical protein